MNEERKKPGLAFWITVALVAVLVAYPLSLGPACWISSRASVGASTVSVVYRPMTWGMSRSRPIAEALGWYSQLGSASDWAWTRSDDAGAEIWHWEPVVSWAPTPLPAQSSLRRLYRVTISA